MYHFYPMYFDKTILLIIPAIIITLWAQINVKSTFGKYSKVMSMSGLTGAEAARRILNSNGLTNVQVMMIPGSLSDNFNPKTNIVSLSESTYNNRSVAAIGVAAHECGHAIQHATGYGAIRVRNAIVPMVNVCSMLSMPIIIAGFFFSYVLIEVGIILFSATVLFQLITLPVEFNASSRAISTIDQYGLLDTEELKGAKKVLKAAALTYVAAALSSLLSLLRLILLFGGRRRD